MDFTLVEGDEFVEAFSSLYGEERRSFIYAFLPEKTANNIARQWDSGNYDAADRNIYNIVNDERNTEIRQKFLKACGKHFMKKLISEEKKTKPVTNNKKEIPNQNGNVYYADIPKNVQKSVSKPISIKKQRNLLDLGIDRNDFTSWMYKFKPDHLEQFWEKILPENIFYSYRSQWNAGRYADSFSRIYDILDDATDQTSGTFNKFIEEQGKSYHSKAMNGETLFRGPPPSYEESFN